jgi:hypothetical protein
MLATTPWETLTSSISGCVLESDDLAYDSVRRVWNGAVDTHPAMIVRCANERDVVAAVRFAREHDVALSVRGGGHDWAGRALCEDGLVLDLSALHNVIVDFDNEIAFAEGGARVGDVVAASQRHELAPVTGTARLVGMAGLMLGGGYGPLSGKHGLACDNLLSARVVLANGEIVKTDERENAELFWALRGGGGRFGVVTSARYRLHVHDVVLTGFVLFPVSQARRVLRGYREIVAEAPDELTMMCGFVGGLDGQPLLSLFPMWCGQLTAGQRVLNQLQSLGTPITSQIGPMAYSCALRACEPYLKSGRRYAIRTCWLSELHESAASALIDGARSAPSPLSTITVHHFHGAASRIPSTQTAFALRRDHLMVEIAAAWESADVDEARANERWAAELSARLSAFALPGGYPNLLGPNESERVRLAYGANADRLRRLASRLDPDGVFSCAVGSFI